jgi:hypothetical protein
MRIVKERVSLGSRFTPIEINVNIDSNIRHQYGIGVIFGVDSQANHDDCPTDAQCFQYFYADSPQA